MATSIKKEFTESTSWQMWRRAAASGTGCSPESFTQFYLPSSLCGVLPDHTYMLGQGERYDWISVGLRCSPHGLHSAPRISPMLALHPLPSRTHSLARHNTALVPNAALRHCCSHSNRGKSCPFWYSKFYSGSNCGRERKVILVSFLTSKLWTSRDFDPPGPCFFLSSQFPVSSTPPAPLAAKQIWQNLVNFSSFLILRSQWEQTILQSNLTGGRIKYLMHDLNP